MFLSLVAYWLINFKPGHWFFEASLTSSRSPIPEITQDPLDFNGANWWPQRKLVPAPLENMEKHHPKWEKDLENTKHSDDIYQQSGTCLSTFPILAVMPSCSPCEWQSSGKTRDTSSTHKLVISLSSLMLAPSVANASQNWTADRVYRASMIWYLGASGKVYIRFGVGLHGKPIWRQTGTESLNMMSCTMSWDPWH